MRNRYSDKVEFLSALGTSEFQRLKVTALNLLHLAAFPPFQIDLSPHVTTQSVEGEEVDLPDIFG